MRQFAWFDCVRCIAILLVMYAHAGDFYNYLPATFTWLAPLLAAINSLAWIGVELFFVLSGFLVSGLLFFEHDKTGALDIKRFLVRRAFKIIPAFYFLLIVTIIYDLVMKRGINRDHFFHDFLFLQNYREGNWAHGWTLALEVHFYILLALLLYFLARNARQGAAWLTSLPWILGGVIIVEFFARWLNSGVRGDGHHFDVHRELQPSHLHLDVLAAGVLLRYLYHYHLEILAIFQRARIGWVLLGLLLVWPSSYLWKPHSALTTALIPTCDALGFSLILFQAAQLPFPSAGWAFWLVKPFDYLGKHSYSIYLWHFPVRDWAIDPFFPVRNLTYVVCYVVASLIVGIFLSEILEMPILHLRDSLFPSQASTSRKAAAGGTPVAVELT